VEASAALPGWTAYVETNQIDRVLHNNLFLSAAGLAVMGPEPGSPQNNYRIEGNYTVLLQGGSVFHPGLGIAFVEAAIAQTGLVPAAAQLLRMPVPLGYSFRPLIRGRGRRSAPSLPFALNAYPLGAGRG